MAATEGTLIETLGASIARTIEKFCPGDLYDVAVLVRDRQTGDMVGIANATFGDEAGADTLAREFLEGSDLSGTIIIPQGKVNEH